MISSYTLKKGHLYFFSNHVHLYFFSNQFYSLKITVKLFQFRLKFFVNKMHFYLLEMQSFLQYSFYHKIQKIFFMITFDEKIWQYWYKNKQTDTVLWVRLNLKWFCLSLNKVIFLKCKEKNTWNHFSCYKCEYNILFINLTIIC